MNARSRVLIASTVTLFAGLFVAGNAGATLLEMNQGYLVDAPLPSPTATGNPSNPLSWLTADFTSVSSTDGYTNTLTLTSYLQSGVFVGGTSGSGGKVTPQIGWAFNFVDSFGLPASIQTSNCISGVCATGIATSNIKVAGPLQNNSAWNLAFSWNNGNGFTGGDTARYVWTSTNKISFLNAGTTTSGYGNLYSVVHLQGYGNGCSSFIINGSATGVPTSTTNGQCDGVAVPEPSELPMMAFGLSLMLAGWFVNKRRKFKKNV